ncbi:hypothetical protein MSG28_009320 [Choristoneura fumiferana]|uniref:Uncharacterized protein n=1 Tax=Choristoneura fumiferana TaxID=7141 RepID=A0ACC0KWX6_CHOFU|nr:hypothetical protein MSG28_009320 [Choristoneura fumiferana]
MTERWNRHSVIRPPKINSSCPLPANLAKTPARTDPAKTTAPVRRKVATTALPKFVVVTRRIFFPNGCLFLERWPATSTILGH